MRFPRKFRLPAAIGAVIVVGIAALAASAFLLSREYVTKQTIEQSFLVDEDFSKVRQILVRTDALKQIITMTGESEFIDQKWTSAGGGIESFNPLNLGWNLKLEGQLKVRTLDPYVGQNEVTLRQVVKIDSDQVHSDIQLEQGSERLLGYQMTVWFLRDASGKTRVQQRLSQDILTAAPWFAHGIADRRVHQSVERALANQERAIRTVFDENREKRWLLFDRPRPARASGDSKPPAR